MYQGLPVRGAMLPGPTEWLVILAITGSLLFSAVLLLSIVVYCQIFRKTGFPWTLGLLVVVPFIGNLIILCILAFGHWPVLRTLRQLQGAED